MIPNGIQVHVIVVLSFVSSDLKGVALNTLIYGPTPQSPKNANFGYFDACAVTCAVTCAGRGSV